MQATTAKSADRLRRAEHAARYAPKARPVTRTSSSTATQPQDMRLRRLTQQVLDELKMPGAIPSNVIYAALAQAAAAKT